MAEQKRNPLTAWLTVLIVVVLLAWDAWVFLRGETTISAVVGRAFSWPWLGWWLCGSFGFLAGHLLGMTDPDSPGFWFRVAIVPMTAAAIGFGLTYRG